MIPSADQFLDKLIFITNVDYCGCDHHTEKRISRAQIFYIFNKTLISTILTRDQIIKMIEHDFCVCVMRTTAHHSINIAHVRRHKIPTPDCPFVCKQCEHEKNMYIKATSDNDETPQDYIGKLPPVTLTQYNPHWFFLNN